MSSDKISRREALKGAVALGAAAGSLAVNEAAAQSGPPSSADPALAAKWANPDLVKVTQSAKMLVNRERANDVMDKYGLDGVVASLRPNIYYLSTHDWIMGKMGRDFTTYAFLPRNESAPPALIVPGSMLYHLERAPTWMPSVQVYTFPAALARGMAADSDNPRSAGGAEDDEGVSLLQARAKFPSGVADSDLSRNERFILALFAQYEGKVAASAIGALKRAITAAGLGKGKLGFDDPRVLGWLNAEGLTTLKGVDALNIFKEIRLQKTENEIEIIRETARKSEDALRYAIGTIRPGQPYEDIEFQFGKRWGELGGSCRWLVVNQRGGGAGKVLANEIMKIDSVGEYRNYKGDVGRTIIAGTPTDHMVRRCEATDKCLRLMYSEIRPGMKWSDAGKIMRDLMAQEGFVGGGGTHCVGLDHTDEPNPLPGEPRNKYADLMRYFEGTVFTYDMVHNELGYGTQHVEDMIVVRKNGIEYLSSGNTELIRRPG